jgi:hypothetical protein
MLPLWLYLRHTVIAIQPRPSLAPAAQKENSTCNLQPGCVDNPSQADVLDRDYAWDYVALVAGPQCWVARMALRWTLTDLARTAGVSPYGPRSSGLAKDSGPSARLRKVRHSPVAD